MGKSEGKSSREGILVEETDDGRRQEEKGRRTYHIISNNSSMPIINLDSINSKDSSHLIDDCRSTRFDTVCL